MFNWSYRFCVIRNTAVKGTSNWRRVFIFFFRSKLRQGTSPWINLCITDYCYERRAAKEGGWDGRFRKGKEEVCHFGSRIKRQWKERGVEQVRNGTGKVRNVKGVPYHSVLERLESDIWVRTIINNQRWNRRKDINEIEAILVTRNRSWFTSKLGGGLDSQGKWWLRQERNIGFCLTKFSAPVLEPILWSKLKLFK